MFLALAKIVHLLTMTFFIGVVSFRTFIMPVLKTKYDKHTYLRMNKLIGLRARGIIKINNIFLILSGMYLLSLHVDTTNVLFNIKVGLGLVLALTFYIVPLIMKKFNHLKWFCAFFHHLFFSLMLSVVVLSQLMFI